MVVVMSSSIYRPYWQLCQNDSVSYPTSRYWHKIYFKKERRLLQSSSAGTFGVLFLFSPHHLLILITSSPGSNILASLGSALNPPCTAAERLCEISLIRLANLLWEMFFSSRPLKIALDSVTNGLKSWWNRAATTSRPACPESPTWRLRNRRRECQKMFFIFCF